MKPTESVKILAVAFAAYPGMSIPVGTPEVWHELLKDLEFEDAKEAVLAHARVSSAIITPADIRRHAALIRDRRKPNVPAIDASAIRQTTPPPEWKELRDRLAARPRRESASLGTAMAAMAEQVAALATAPAGDPSAVRHD